MSMPYDDGMPKETYKQYKSRLFSKRIEKLRSLFNSIDDLSLLESDKKLLKEKLKNEISNL